MAEMDANDCPRSSNPVGFQCVSKALIRIKGIEAAPFGGRILGLFPDGKTNLLWVNPRVGDSSWLADAQASGVWCNIGGERLWISPEIDTMVGDPERFAESYAVPPQLDPGEYDISMNEGSLTLALDVTLNWRRSAREIGFGIRSNVQAMDDCPLEIASGIEFAGYTNTVTFFAKSELGDATPSCWNLLQVPLGGEIRMKVNGEAEPVSFIGKAEWQKQGNLLKTAAQATRSFKWSLRANACSGRMVYYRELGGERASLVVREFPVTENQDYGDCPCHNPADTGHMCQVYVDDGRLGDFAELEAHGPCLRAGLREIIRTEFTTLGFIGNSHGIRDLSARLLE